MTENKTQSGPVAREIAARLTREFDPNALKLIDESALHAGHSGEHPEGESHFRVEIVSERFDGMNRVARHRAVNAAVADLLAERVHAFAISAKTPGEASA